MQNFYNVTTSEDGLVNTFTTRFNIKYYLTLTSYQMGEVRVFSLSLYPETESTVFDYWIKNTVIKLIAEFLKEDSNVVFYICDNLDNKENKRFKIFNYWYNKAKELHPLVAKYDYTFISEHDYTLYSSLLINRQNPLFNFIIEQLHEEMRLY